MPNKNNFMGLITYMSNIHPYMPVSIVRTSPLKRGGLVPLVIFKKVGQILRKVVNSDLLKISVVRDRLSQCLSGGDSWFVHGKKCVNLFIIHLRTPLSTITVQGPTYVVHAQMSVRLPISPCNKHKEYLSCYATLSLMTPSRRESWFRGRLPYFVFC